MTAEGGGNAGVRLHGKNAQKGSLVVVWGGLSAVAVNRESRIISYTRVLSFLVCSSAAAAHGQQVVL